MEPGVPIILVLSAAIVLFILGLFLRKFRVGIGIALLVLGVIATATGIGAIVGIPILFVGLIVLLLELLGRRRRPR